MNLHDPGAWASPTPFVFPTALVAVRLSRRIFPPCLWVGNAARTAALQTPIPRSLTPPLSALFMAAILWETDPHVSLSASYKSLEIWTLIPALSGGLSVCFCVSEVKISFWKYGFGIKMCPDEAAVRMRNTRECCIAVFDLGSDSGGSIKSHAL